MYEGTTLVRQPATATRSLTTVVHRIVADAGPDAARRFVEFFTATIRNPNTREAYARAVRGPFINRARQMADNGRPTLAEQDLDELDAIKEYANRFHHDSNPAWDVVVNNINEIELLGFVQRVIAFATRR